MNKPEYQLYRIVEERGRFYPQVFEKIIRTSIERVGLFKSERDNQRNT